MFHPNSLIRNCTGKGLEDVEELQFDPKDGIAFFLLMLQFAAASPTPSRRIAGRL